MTTATPTTFADFVSLGSRIPNAALLREMGRLVDQSNTNAAVLSDAEWEHSDTAELVKLRAQIPDVAVARGTRRASKKASGSTVTGAIKRGKYQLQAGMASARLALSRRTRTTPAGEDTATTQQIATATSSQIDALEGSVGNDANLLGIRLGNLLTVLGLPALAPTTASRKKSRAKLVAAIEKARAGLPSLTAVKTSLTNAALQDTAQQNALKGQAYELLRRLAAIGHAQFRLLGDHATMGAYQLTALHAEIAAAANGTEPPPATGTGGGTTGSTTAPATTTPPQPTQPQIGSRRRKRSRK